jgi:hypothetical protein
MKSPVAPEVLRQLLRYEPETGKLYWLPRPVAFFGDTERRRSAANQWNARHAGKEAFTADNGEGYLQGSIFDRLYRAHRVIWCLMTGEWPTALIDHRDGDRGNNKWKNLRAATRSQNNRNTCSRLGSSSKYLGVYWEKQRGKWVAAINIGKRPKVLGCFASEEEAARAYDHAASREYGDFARSNFAISPRPGLSRSGLFHSETASDSDAVGQSDGPRRA